MENSMPQFYNENYKGQEDLAEGFVGFFGYSTKVIFDKNTSIAYCFDDTKYPKRRSWTVAKSDLNFNALIVKTSFDVLVKSHGYIGNAQKQDHNNEGMKDVFVHLIEKMKETLNVGEDVAKFQLLIKAQQSVPKVFPGFSVDTKKAILELF